MSGRTVDAPRAIGILGGTFDPVHVGHLALAREARRALDLERVLFVPNAQPPHKRTDDVSPSHDREAMLSLAIAGTSPPSPSRASNSSVPGRATRGHGRRARVAEPGRGTARAVVHPVRRGPRRLPHLARTVTHPGTLPRGGVAASGHRDARPRLGDGALPGSRGPLRVPGRARPRRRVHDDPPRVSAGQSIEGLVPARWRAISVRPASTVRQRRTG